MPVASIATWYLHAYSLDFTYQNFVGGFFDLSTSAALTVNCLCLCIMYLLQKWRLLGCGSWLLVYSGWCSGVDKRQMDSKVCSFVENFVSVEYVTH